MNFYYSLYQLISTVEGLEHSVQELASRALRISPRDARTNRELLEQCEAKLGEVKDLLDHKTHISRTDLRKAGTLFEVLELAHLRMVHLAGAMNDGDGRNENARAALLPMLILAQDHYRRLAGGLAEMTGIPVWQCLTEVGEDGGGELSSVLEKEACLQRETVRLLEKAIKAYEGDEAWLEQLRQIRSELLGAQRGMKRLSVVRAPAIRERETAALPVGA